MPRLRTEQPWANNLTKLRAADGQKLGEFSLPGPSGAQDLTYDSVQQYIWVAHQAAVTRLSEANGAIIGTTPFPFSSVRKIDHDGSNIWLLDDAGLQKLDANANVVANSDYALSTDLFDFLYDGAATPSLWVGTRLSGPKLRLTQINPAIPDSGSFIVQQGEKDVSQLEQSGIAHRTDKNHVWLGQLRFDATDISNPLSINPICTPTSDLLYHSATQSVWASCPADGAIQKIYSY